MGSEAESGDPAPVALPVPEIRDYHQVNRRVVQLLDGGATRLRLEGVEGQRLLLAGLRGAWRARVEVVGSAGPELAQGLDAPGLEIVCDGPAADGAGSGLRAGRLVVGGDAGAGLGYGMAGGELIVGGSAGPRAGLEQRGGVIVVWGGAGPLAGERQRGGVLVLAGARVGGGVGLARCGGVVASPGGRVPGTVSIPAGVAAMLGGV
jgi:glutamate synthase domain-containing protein 3